MKQSWMRKIGALLAIALLAAAGGPLAGPAAFAQTPAKPDLKIGVLLPSTGIWTVLGEAQNNAIQMYFDDQKNQIGGRKIVLVREDEETGADIALRKVRKLVEQDKVEMVVGVISSASALAIAPYLTQNQVPLVITNAGAATVTGRGSSPWIFRAAASTPQLADPLGKWAAANFGRTAINFVPDYVAGREFDQYVRNAYQGAGGRVADTVLAPLNTADFGPYFPRLQQPGVDFVVTSFQGAGAIRLIQQWRDFGLRERVKLITLAHMLEDDVLAQVGEAATGLYSVSHWAYDLLTPSNRQFVRAFEQRFNKRADAQAVQAYDGARAIGEAVKKLDGATGDKQKLLDAIAGVKFRGPRGEFYFDRDTRNVVLTMYVRRVAYVNGRATNRVLATVKDVKHFILGN